MIFGFPGFKKNQSGNEKKHIGHRIVQGGNLKLGEKSRHKQKESRNEKTVDSVHFYVPPENKVESQTGDKPRAESNKFLGKNRVNI
jgi:ribosome maturation protein Sdo1